MALWVCAHLSQTKRNDDDDFKIKIQMNGKVMMMIMKKKNQLMACQKLMHQKCIKIKAKCNMNLYDTTYKTYRVKNKKKNKNRK